MDLSRSVVVQHHSYLPICPKYACPWAQNLSNLAALGLDFVELISLKPLDGFIPFEVLWNCLDLQLCNVMLIWHWPWIFKVKFGKCCILGMGGPVDMEWKGWVDRMLGPHCDFELWFHQWPWPLIFEVKFWKSCNSGMGCQIDMERKGCEPIGC